MNDKMTEHDKLFFELIAAIGKDKSIRKDLQQAIVKIFDLELKNLDKKQPHISPEIKSIINKISIDRLD